MVTGFWPPTNEMLVEFSTSSRLNPRGWQGKNWQGRGYDIYAFFPTFSRGTLLNPKGNGDFEVDYQDTARDFWRITKKIKPVAIISFGLGSGPWEIEFNARNLPPDSWQLDYLAPRMPASRPNLSADAGSVLHSTLPVRQIAKKINKANFGVRAWIDYNGNPSAFLCEYLAYHVMWYQTKHSSKSDVARCIAGGFIHAGYIGKTKASRAFKITLRETINYVDMVLSKP